MNFSEIIEHVLDEVLPKEDARPAILSQAMRYAVGTGGKRVRPRICLAAALGAGGNVEDARYPAAAIELLHNYTLVPVYLNEKISALYGYSLETSFSERTEYLEITPTKDQRTPTTPRSAVSTKTYSIIV